jgi:hypothetical protein
MAKSFRSRLVLGSCRFRPPWKSLMLGHGAGVIQECPRIKRRRPMISSFKLRVAVLAVGLAVPTARGLSGIVAACAAVPGTPTGKPSARPTPQTATRSTAHLLAAFLAYVGTNCAVAKGMRRQTRTTEALR